jgi:MFS family permease
MKADSEVFYLYAARAARGFGDGFAAILPAYLIEVGFNPFEIGVVAAAGLLGSAALTLAIGFLAPRYALRTLLMACAFFMILTGVAMPLSDYSEWHGNLLFQLRIRLATTQPIRLPKSLCRKRSQNFRSAVLARRPRRSLRSMRCSS